MVSPSRCGGSRRPCCQNRGAGLQTCLTAERELDHDIEAAANSLATGALSMDALAMHPILVRPGSLRPGSSPSPARTRDDGPGCAYSRPALDEKRLFAEAGSKSWRVVQTTELRTRVRASQSGRGVSCEGPRLLWPDRKWPGQPQNIGICACVRLSVLRALDRLRKKMTRPSSGQT